MEGQLIALNKSKDSLEILLKEYQILRDKYCMDIHESIVLLIVQKLHIQADIEMTEKLIKENNYVQNRSKEIL